MSNQYQLKIVPSAAFDDAKWVALVAEWDRNFHRQRSLGLGIMKDPSLATRLYMGLNLGMEGKIAVVVIVTTDEIEGENVVEIASRHDFVVVVAVAADRMQ